MLEITATTRETVRESKRDDIPGEAAKVAFYAFLSLFPLILVTLTLTGIIGGKGAFDLIMGRIQGSLPAETAGLLEQYVREVTDRPQPGLLSIGALLLLWSASGAFAALGESLNVVFDVEDERSFVRRRGIALAFALGIGVVLLLSAVTLLAGPEIAEAAGVGGAWTIMQWPVVFALIALVLYATYRFLPAPQPRVRRSQRIVGSFAGAVLWVGATALFRFYVSNFGSYAKTYGAIGAVIVLMLWLMISAAVVLVGGEITMAMARRKTGHTRAPRPSYA
ncbi:MAG: YihY/virulence factor BrkB family protein [Deltaproteobacteria bacterium]|nr:YihY/virulence factor BrkB family protein [Deltaproteobacteria bacterium]